MTEETQTQEQEQTTDADEGIVAIHLCELCGELNRTRFQNHLEASRAAVCGVCDRGPLTRVYGAVEPVRRVELGIKEAGYRGLIDTCYRIRDSEEWDLQIEALLTRAAAEDEDLWDPIVSIADELRDIGYRCRVAGGEDPDDEEWDSRVEIQVEFPHESAVTGPTFTEFLEGE